MLCVHTSFSRIRDEGWTPDAFIDALIDVVGPDGTVAMPAWTDRDDIPFDPATDDIQDHLGIVAHTFWQRPDVKRGPHPFTMAATGRHADRIVDAPLVLPPHDEGSGIAIVNELDGWVLLAGCDHDADSAIHLGELRGGAPYRVRNRITITEDGRPREIWYAENDSCCQRFNLVGDWLEARGLQRTGPLGRGTAKLARSRDIVDTVIEELRDDPTRFLHPRGECEECDGSWASIQEPDR